MRGVQGAALWPGAVSPPGTPPRAFPAEPGQRRAAARRGREKERAGGRERPAMRGAPPAAGEGCACNEPRRAAAQSEPSAAEAPAPRRSPPCINKYRARGEGGAAGGTGGAAKGGGVQAAAGASGFWRYSKPFPIACARVCASAPVSESEKVSECMQHTHSLTIIKTNYQPIWSSISCVAFLQLGLFSRQR